jgi:non-canonical poly(A) RNA polymerase PAPD5/7
MSNNNRNQIIIVGKKSAEKLLDLTKHDIEMAYKEPDETTLLKKKRKNPEIRKEFKLLFPQDDSASDNDNIKKLNKALQEDNMEIEDINKSPTLSDTQRDAAREQKAELLAQDFISFPKKAKIEKKITPDEINRKYPWLTKRTKKLKGMLRLDSEIYDFFNFIKPTEEENDIRMRTFNIVREVVKEINPNWKVKKFGSFPTQIHLPDSDVDIIILTEEKIDSTKLLKKIRNKFIDSNCVEYINLIEARVPIIRATMKETKINIDIR